MANSAIFAIGSFGSKILQFLLIRLYTDYLPTDGFGVTDLIVKTANLLIPIVTLSIVEAVMRYGLDEKENKQKVFTVGISVAFFGLAIVTAFSPLVDRISYFQGYTPLLFVYLFTSSLRAINQQFLRTRGLVKLYSFDGILTTLIMLLCNVLFLVVMEMGVAGYLLSIIVSDALSALFLFFAGENYRFFKVTAFDRELAVRMIRYAAPLIPTAVLWWVVSSSDSYMVTYWLGKDMNGLYAAAYKIPTIIAIISTIFFQAWQMSAISEYKSADARRFFSMIFHAYQSIMYIAAGGIIIFLRPLMGFLIKNEDYATAYRYTPFLIVAVLMSCSCTFLSYIYAATMHTKNSFYTSLIAALTNIILNFLMIPASTLGYGVNGAALATMASYTLCFVVRLIDTRRYINYKVKFGQVLVNFTLIIAMALISVAEFDNYLLVVAGLYVPVVAVNFKAVLQTVKKVTEKK